MKYKTVLGIIILLGIATIPAYACFVCAPCNDGTHVCVGGPSTDCFCFHSDVDCVTLECKDGYWIEYCCSLFNPNLSQSENHRRKPHHKGEYNTWIVTLSNGVQITLFFSELKAESEDVLKLFTDDEAIPARLTARNKNEKLLTAVTAVKLDK